VGLKNQGATCYMNSLLQQLFHIPGFRHGLLSLELEGQGEKGAKEEEEEEEKGDKSVLFELQSLFALLQTSEKKAADTLAFCRSLTDYSGEPLLLHEQKDVDEFATLLFDKLESLDPRMDGLLKGLFGGTLVNQVISHECPHRSEREEPFPMLKVDIKNKSSLEDSLELYVAGELLAGDNKYACRYGMEAGLD
jgi:ubiquitin C-terminal hydrolase